MIENTWFKRFGFGLFLAVSGWILVTYFIQPIFRWLGALFQTTSMGAAAWFFDTMYKSAARGPNNDLDVAILSWSCSLLTGLLLGWSITELFERFHKDKPEIDQDKPPKRHRLNKSLKVACYIFLFLGALLVNLAVYQMTTIYNLTVVFQQQMAILAPNLTDQEEEEVTADWAVMKNRNDYKSLKVRIYKYAESFNKPKILPK